MRRILILFLILIGLVAAGLTFVNWPTVRHNYEKLTVHPEQADLQQAKELLIQDRPEEALTILNEHADEIDFHTDLGKEWLDLLIRASAAISNVEQLQRLYEFYPKAFDSHEKAALLMANEYLLTNQIQQYQTLRETWKGRETRPEIWFVHDSDKLLLQGKRKEAIDFLNSRTFPGKSDSTRLVRLALLYVFEEPKTAWGYLTQAHSKDPENPDIRSYRAKLLETVGKQELAQLEYQSAVEIDPQNPYLKDQLAEFYIRTKQVPEALKIWHEQLKTSSLDFIWLKALFWSRVATPVSFDWAAIPPPHGSLEPFIEYLTALKPGTFWDTTAFERIPGGKTYLSTQQATFWLRLIEELKLGKEKEAYELLQYSPFNSLSWNHQLEESLKRILLYRKTGRFLTDSDTIKVTAAAKGEPSLFEQIELFQNDPTHIPADLYALITGPEAFTAAFLTAGWDESAIALHTTELLPPTYPDWVTVSLTKAIRKIQGNAKALEFATVQKPSSNLSLLISELLIAKGRTEEALQRLSKLQSEDSDVGFRASWLLSTLYMEHGQYEEAKAAIQSQPRLRKNVLGKETLARIALLEGDLQGADAMYTAMEAHSPEAQSYLARKAFQNRDWKQARELTEKLLVHYPNNNLLRENLKKIKEEQGKF